MDLMVFFKAKRFRRIRKLKAEENPDLEKSESPSEESKDENISPTLKATATDAAAEAEDEDEFFMNEVTKRLKELRRNSSMDLIPEEAYPEEEEEEASSSEWRESEAGVGYLWIGFDTLYDKYCERMLFFDKMSTQQLNRGAPWTISNRSPRVTSKKLALTLQNLAFKRREELQEDSEHLSQIQENDPYQALETAYVAQVSLSWETLHCQYMQLRQKISYQPDNAMTYNYAAQAFQQFQVLLQRFIENEPFKQGCRVEIYARTRSALPNLLQIPNFQGFNEKGDEEGDLHAQVLASDLIKLMEESILTFYHFLKTAKEKWGPIVERHSDARSSLQQIQASLNKKEIKVKEILKKKKGWKKKTWPTTLEGVELLFALIDISVVSRVLRMESLSKEQLLWCEEKISKLDLSTNKLCRDGSPILFPC